MLKALAAGANRLLSVRDVAELLAVHPSTVYGLCELPYVRVSNAIRIRDDDVAAYMRRPLLPSRMTAKAPGVPG